MSVVRTIGTGTRIVAGQTVTLTATLERDDVNGQLFLRVAGSIGTEIHERKHSIGAADGRDAFAGLTPADIAATVQGDLDALRQDVARTLAARAGVAAAANLLT